MENQNKTNDIYHSIPVIWLSEEETPVDNALAAIILVDTDAEGSDQKLQNIMHSLSEKRIFSIAIFIAGRYDWTFDNSMMLGLNAWFVAASKEDAINIANSIQKIVEGNGLIELDVNDLKTILSGDNGHKAYFAKGTSQHGDMKEALNSAVDDAANRGLDIYGYDKFLFCFDAAPNLLKDQLVSFNYFIDHVSRRHQDNFEIKWGIAKPSKASEDLIEVIILASNRK